jgi:putative peptidoglycan lipid II flippase
VGLPIRLLGMAIGQAALPRLAALNTAGDLAGLWRTLRQALLAACGLAGLSAGALLILGRPLIQLLFERGAFDAAAGDLTYRMLAAYSLGLPAYVATEVLGRALVSRLDTRTPLITNCLQFGIRLALMLSLIGSVGAVLVPLAFAASSIVEAAILYAVLRRQTGGPPGQTL